MKENIFRAYDIRGTYPDEINEDIFFELGKSYGSYLIDKYSHLKCVVSHDNRLSSKSLTRSLVKGITASGCSVVYLSLTTTPMNYFARKHLGLPGIMVTASHNPKDDNGLKFSFNSPINARGKMISDFKDYTLKGEFFEGNGEIERLDIFEEYYNYLYKSIKPFNKKLKVVFDPGNGVGSDYVKRVFDNLKIDAIFINDESDGSFPNHHPDPRVEENLNDLKKAVLDNNADFGIAYDGDADRLGIVDDKGNALPIEYFMNICVSDIFDKVENKTFLYDIKCSKTFEDYVTSLGGNVLCYRTGASYTQYKTHKENLPFGCEYSGHVYFRDRDFDCCSAFYASLRFIEIMSNTDKKLSEIIKEFNHYYATEEIRVPSDDEKKFIVTEKILEYAKEKGYKYNDIDGVRITFDDGWVLVRASNTGPNLTVRCEATTEERLEYLKEKYLHKVNEYNK